jgi:hypothetical protein
MGPVTTPSFHLCLFASPTATGPPHEHHEYNNNPMLKIIFKIAPVFFTFETVEGGQTTIFRISVQSFGGKISHFSSSVSLASDHHHLAVG